MSAFVVQTQPISSLPSATPDGVDIFLLLKGGIAKQATIADIRLALALATETDKGLLSASDKTILDLNASELAAILAPTTYTIASAATISVASGATFVILTGTTTVTGITGLTTGYPVQFYYPTGAGLTFLGNTVQAGDPPLIVLQTP